MKWFEPILIAISVLLVIFPIVSYSIKKKNGTLKCDCGHERSKCTGSCENCNKKEGNKSKLVYLVSVEGMKCGACESHISNFIRNNFDVIKVKSSRKNKSTTIISNHFLNVKQIKESIIGLGYEVDSIKLIDVK